MKNKSLWNEVLFQNGLWCANPDIDKTCISILWPPSFARRLQLLHCSGSCHPPFDPIWERGYIQTQRASNKVRVRVRERGSIELWESLRVFVHWPSFPSGKLLLSCCCCCCCCFCCYYCRIPAAWQGSLVCASLATLSALITRWLQMESSPGTTHTVSKWTFQRVLHWPTIWLEGRAGGSLCNHLGFWFCGWMFSLIAGVCFFTQGLSIVKVVFFLFFGLLEDVPKSIFACMARSIP